MSENTSKIAAVTAAAAAAAAAFWWHAFGRRGAPKDAIGAPVSGLRTPAYLLYLDVATRNADRMLARAERLGCALRPHVKTHKTLEGGVLQTGGTRRRIVVSTLREAQFFANGGFDDILYAVPITPDKLADAAALTLQLDAFHIMVDNSEQLRHVLRAAPPSRAKPWSVVLMVDCGYHRDGVDPDDPASLELVRSICDADTAVFAGIYTHGGHSYDCGSAAEIRDVAVVERDSVVRFSRQIRAAGFPCGMCGIGSTPTCSHPPEDGLDGVNEMHPGNYFVYDVVQADSIRSCRREDVATRVLTRVIGHYPASNMLLIDLGWTGCSAQGAATGYGAFEGHPELRIEALKQEAGEVTCAVEGQALDFSRYPIGTMLRLMPYHACAAGAMHPKVHVVDRRQRPEGEGGEEGEESVAAVWRSCRGWEL